MSLKQNILDGLVPALTTQIKAGLESGKIEQPVDLEKTMDQIWKNLKLNVQTAGAILVFGIKREDIKDIVKKVCEDLKIAIK